MDNPFNIAFALFVALVVVLLINVPRIFGMFQRNTATGKVIQFNRTLDGNLAVTLEAISGEYTFIAYPPLAGQLETYIFTQRSQQRSVVLTIEYDPHDGQTVLNFSAVTS